MKMIACCILFLLATNSSWAADCKNPSGKKSYLSNPEFFSPDGTRGEGLRVKVKGNYVQVPDVRPQCLPIPVRYNNFGALKTRSKGPWAGQVSRDRKGHAVFKDVESGLSAWGTWIAARTKEPKSAFEIMSIYAPPTDCVGSIGTPPDKCPYGINPTAQYAAQVASAVGKTAHDKLNLDATDCREGRDALFALFVEVATFEIGSNFCGGRCDVDRDLFDRAIDKAIGPVSWGQCADPPEAHLKE